MQIYIFGAARTGSNLTKDDAQLALKKLISGQRVLDWTIYGLKKAGIKSENITFVGGYQIESVINLYPKLNYCVNPRWDETHVVGSLKYALDSWKGGDILLMYADTVFRPAAFKKLLETQDFVSIGIDKQWKNRVESHQLRYNAEKVVLKNNFVKNVGRRSITVENADAQFTGLTFIKREIVEKIHSYFFTDQNSSINLSDQDSLTDLLRVLKNEWNVNISSIDLSGSWAELDTFSDLAKFVFGTKAETLERIKPFVKNSKICDQIHFRLKDWEDSSNQLLSTIQNKFTGLKLIIRSSSLEEDSWDSSQAGAFLSVSDVNADDGQELKKAIDDVIEGFRQNGSGQYNQNNQILVQPFIKNVAMSGVAFSKHLENSTPYFLINYDDVSKRTDTVTSGSTSDSKSITVYKGGVARPKDSRLTKVINAIEELENITGYESLDIEFVLTDNLDLFIVQVRPITIHAGLNEDVNFSQRLEDSKNKIRTRLKNYPHIFGDTTILADMPDWNPAEMIGIRPNPLSVSLYQHLITDSAWRIARGAMGYHNPSPENLLFCIAGHPYIDVRNSFNNLIPADLRPELADKLINHYIKRLKKHPHLHDKVEFEIVITCFTPDFDDHAQRLVEDGFSEAEINELKMGLKNITENAITGKLHSLYDLNSKTDSLNPRREKLISSGYEHSDIPTLIQILLDDCIDRGTIPFSILARYGFIASSMLRGFVSKGIITEEMKNDFLNSIETVAGKMVDDMNGVLAGTYPKDSFLSEYGHLRPGSYDITSYSYKEKPEYYFPNVIEEKSGIGEAEVNKKVFTFDENTCRAIEKEVDSMRMNITVDQLLTFIKDATAAREYAKFQFTKNLNEVLTLITEWGEQYRFTRSDLSCLFIQDILKLNKFTLSRENILYLKQKIQEGREWHERSNKIETPQLITSPEDLDVIEHNVSDPNFVTSKVVTAPIYYMSGDVDKSKLEGSIVLTEGADPGYDWIFLHPIKGLITRYGGAASHMTIRCAEFGLPAAIGCGEEWHKKLKTAKNVELNCSNKQIKIHG
jgi:glutamine kinase